jgi:hypothetical protein
MAPTTIVGKRIATKMGRRASGGATAIGTAVKNGATRHVNTSHSLTNLQARRRGFLIELVRLPTIGSWPREPA